MTSRSSFPVSFTRIDDLTRADHFYLTDEDHCFFLGEYAVHAGYQYSETNRLILNFKKSVEHKEADQWQYKIEAIKFIANVFRRIFDRTKIAHYTFVPIPPSKDKTHELYDDRIPQMLNKIYPDGKLDIRKLIIQETAMPAAHKSAIRPTPDDIQGNYKVDELLKATVPKTICIVDDMLTTGAHFKAAKNLLSQHFPNSNIIGLFVARRALGSLEEKQVDI